MLLLIWLARGIISHHVIRSSFKVATLKPAQIVFYASNAGEYFGCVVVTLQQIPHLVYNGVQARS